MEKNNKKNNNKKSVDNVQYNSNNIDFDKYLLCVKKRESDLTEKEIDVTQLVEQIFSEESENNEDKIADH